MSQPVDNATCNMSQPGSQTHTTQHVALSNDAIYVALACCDGLAGALHHIFCNVARSKNFGVKCHVTCL